MTATCTCGCGRPRRQKRLGPSHYEVLLGGRSIGTVRRETIEIEQHRPGLCRSDTHWTNSADDEWSATRGEAIDILLMVAHARLGHHRPTAVKLEPMLRAGLAWLYDTEQPAGALDQHHGTMSPVLGGRRYRFIPEGDPGTPGPIVGVDVAHPRYRDAHELANPLGGPTEVAEVVAALARLGHAAVATWNGTEGCGTASIALGAKAHPSLLAAVHRYHDGCPTHGHVFCGHENGCTWFRDGRRLLVEPTWPELDRDARRRS